MFNSLLAIALNVTPVNSVAMEAPMENAPELQIKSTDQIKVRKTLGNLSAFKTDFKSCKANGGTSIRIVTAGPTLDYNCMKGSVNRNPTTKPTQSSYIAVSKVNNQDIFGLMIITESKGKLVLSFK